MIFDEQKKIDLLLRIPILSLLQTPLAWIIFWQNTTQHRIINRQSYNKRCAIYIAAQPFTADWRNRVRGEIRNILNFVCFKSVGQECLESEACVQSELHWRTTCKTFTQPPQLRLQVSIWSLDNMIDKPLSRSERKPSCQRSSATCRTRQH